MRWLIITLLLGLIACRKPPKDSPPASNNTSSPTPYTLQLPPEFPVMKIPEDNPLTKEGVALGRKLYYDVRLSQGGPMQGHACATCHVQSFSFANNAAGVSVMPHVNLGYSNAFLWKGNVQGTLEDVMLFEVKDFFQVDTAYLATLPEYPPMFKAAFGSETITHQPIAYALAQFVRTLISGNSKFDRYYRGEVMLSDAEMRGMMIFFSERGDCFHCHPLPLFTDYEFHNIGLDSVFTGENQGLYLITKNPADLGKFRTPTLRNVALTAPYMHDGRFATLQEVIDHYSDHVKASPTLDPIMSHNNRDINLRLTPQEKADLIAFLLTLTDSTFINNPDFGPPQ